MTTKHGGVPFFFSFGVDDLAVFSGHLSSSILSVHGGLLAGALGSGMVFWPLLLFPMFKFLFFYDLSFVFTVDQVLNCHYQCQWVSCLIFMGYVLMFLVCLFLACPILGINWRAFYSSLANSP